MNHDYHDKNYILCFVVSKQWKIFGGCYLSNPSRTYWRAKGGFFFGGIPMPTCIFLHNWSDYLSWWRDYCEWLQLLMSSRKWCSDTPHWNMFLVLHQGMFVNLGIRAWLQLLLSKVNKLIQLTSFVHNWGKKRNVVSVMHKPLSLAFSKFLSCILNL